MTLMGAYQKETQILPSALAGDDLSPARSFGLWLLLAAFIMLEILLPRIGDDRPNLPLFVLLALGILITNYKYFFGNLKALFFRLFSFFHCICSGS
ncbi:MAG: hypothetical protein CO093_01085 [Alphaproteobacteria bacterium CG_4_9_14_3_um_filter_47_13]|nr:MAG: hypothetical protein CO093_01085 [Alphaproteobacteria bacterium CG_4_9_14_3_um_filter_47_13]